MKGTIAAIVFAILVFAGIAYFYYGRPSSIEDSSSTDTITAPATPSTSATNYDECIAEGNKPLPDSPDKCLTSDGHVFIQGVAE